LFFIASASAEIGLSYYHQMVHLGNSGNTISQGLFRVNFQSDYYRLYAGLYLDTDTQSNNDITFTDQQVSPLVGIESKVKIYSRLYAEVRDINRVGEFPDNRASQTDELRFGAIGYNYEIYNSLIFTEWYYNVFFSHLYDDKFIIQFWHKHGFSYGNLSLFNELLVDSFDLTSDASSVKDFRPGLRYKYSGNSHYSIQFLIQHTIPIDEKDRKQETRGSLIAFLNY
jgi:hypothetical protein